MSFLSVPSGSVVGEGRSGHFERTLLKGLAQVRRPQQITNAAEFDAEAGTVGSQGFAGGRCFSRGY